MNVPSEWSARRAVNSRKVSFTGLPDVHDSLRRIPLLPQRVSVEAHQGEEVSENTVSGGVEAKCEFLDTMESVIRHSRVNYLELACSLSFSSGSRLLEIVKTAESSAIRKITVHSSCSLYPLFSRNNCLGVTVHVPNTRQNDSSSSRHLQSVALRV